MTTLVTGDTAICTFDGCEEPPAPNSTLGMCPRHNHRASTLLSNQRSKKRRPHNSGRVHWWNTIPHQYLTHEDLDQIERVLGKLTEEEYLALLGKPPQLPMPVSRRRSIGLGTDTLPSYIAPKLIAYLRGDFTAPDHAHLPRKILTCRGCDRKTPACECHPTQRVPLPGSSYRAAAAVLANMSPNEIGALLGPTAPRFPKNKRMLEIHAGRVSRKVLVAVARGEVEVMEVAA